MSIKFFKYVLITLILCPLPIPLYADVFPNGEQLGLPLDIYKYDSSTHANAENAAVAYGKKETGRYVAFSHADRLDICSAPGIFCDNIRFSSYEEAAMFKNFLLTSTEKTSLFQDQKSRSRHSISEYSKDDFKISTSTEKFIPLQKFLDKLRRQEELNHGNYWGIIGTLRKNLDWLESMRTPNKNQGGELSHNYTPKAERTSYSSEKKEDECIRPAGKPGKFCPASSDSAY